MMITARQHLSAVILASFLVVVAWTRTGAAFPAAEWETVAPQSIGWDPVKLEAAHDFASEIGSAAVMVIQDDKVLADWGDTAMPFAIHSMRKSLMSALIGMAVAQGQVDLDSTLQQLGLDDSEPSLSDAEKQARVRDLLMARSGIYHDAAYETQQMKAQRPPRGSHPPGTFWYYNNWDFNVLAAVLKQGTGLDFYEAFKAWLATPTGMQDYDPADGKWVNDANSNFPAYTLRLSARDLARFGLLYLSRGTWNDRQIVPASWVAESTHSYSDAGPGLGYGYLWWVATGAEHFLAQTGPGAYSARGYLGQYVVVIPKRHLVVVHLCDSDRRGPGVAHQDFNKLLGKILAAAPEN
jgi:CubicO group peptidase (beta-lactamase class C family)